MLDLKLIIDSININFIESFLRQIENCLLPDTVLPPDMLISLFDSISPHDFALYHDSTPHSGSIALHDSTSHSGSTVLHALKSDHDPESPSDSTLPLDPKSGHDPKSFLGLTLPHDSKSPSDSTQPYDSKSHQVSTFHKGSDFKCQEEKRNLENEQKTAPTDNFFSKSKMSKLEPITMYKAIKILENEQKTAPADKSSPEKLCSYYAFLLYTNEDNEIAKYVREYFDYLNHLSRDDCIVYLLDPELPNYDAYKIADILKVGHDKFPCLVFFKRGDDKQIIVYRLKNSHDEFKQEFREIFTDVGEIVNKLGQNASTEDLWNALHKRYNIKTTVFYFNVLKGPISDLIFGYLKKLVGI